ncbi:hypothetical protein COO60DRAFT_1511439 [Scenedesmus sp. NREL 46B-D3]|nr:hypothetical protein COO60DRAFT_1511439 [Scenedesmus sp. NREL 46B-D3]
MLLALLLLLLLRLFATPLLPPQRCSADARMCCACMRAGGCATACSATLVACRIAPVNRRVAPCCHAALASGAVTTSDGMLCW